MSVCARKPTLPPRGALDSPAMLTVSMTPLISVNNVSHVCACAAGSLKAVDEGDAISRDAHRMPMLLRSSAAVRFSPSNVAISVTPPFLSR